MAKIYKVKWLPSVLQDLTDIVDYIAHHSGVSLAVMIAERLIERIKSLSQYPERGRIVPELKALGFHSYREVIVDHYRISFYIEDKTVSLVAILDSRREIEEILFERISQH